ncbi:putative malate dehydrogenase 1B [Anneissia japonica]|uniref:putative malate dehydrogenase 1B n=1 Tax=Anneissia japonica TaxID=1529436 RepID=UPI001425B8E9|nr:putative malate dehydrogenase 1B [Anneissia japonica]
MAKFVIAGRADCPYYARTELLADNLQTNLADFKIHKIVKTPEEWEEWLSITCNKNGWQHQKSPIVWRELIDRGGKGVLIGGCNEFQEYAYGYYGIQSEMASSDMKKISAENLCTNVLTTQEEEHLKSLSNPLKVCITNASKPMAYYMVYEIARGDVFGPKTEISLTLLVENKDDNVIKGLVMEAEDLACTLLRKVIITSDPQEAFNGVSAVVFLDGSPLQPEESCDDWLKLNAQIFREYGKILNSVAANDVKVLVAGDGPLNFNAYMLGTAAPAVARQNIVAVARLLENRAKAALARKLNVNSAFIVDLITWGNISGTSLTDVNKAAVHQYDGAIVGPEWYSRPVKEMVHDDKWLQTEFLDNLKSHENTLTKTLGHCATLSAASAVIGVLKDWWNGSKDGKILSLGVFSEGWYELPPDIVFSLPVKFHQGCFEVVQDVDVSDDNKRLLETIAKEIIAEKEVIFPSSRKNSPTPEPNPDETKVFGTDPNGGEQNNLAENPANVPESDDVNVDRSGPLSRIVEEAEPDIKDAESTTDTEKQSIKEDDEE